MKKILLPLLAFCLLLAWAQAGAPPAARQFHMAGYDDSQSYHDWPANQFFARLQAITGTSWRFTQYSDLAQWKKALAAMQPGDGLPDALFKAELSGAECALLLDRGVLIDLKPYIDSHCPNLAALMRADQAIAQAITLPDGRIAALPFVDLAPAQNCMWINKKWLDAVKMPLPETAEQLENTLRLFLERDPNGNGRADEIPLSFLGPYDLKYLSHAYGLAGNDFNLFVRDGKVLFLPLQTDYRAFLNWCRSLYQQKLLDQDGFANADLLRKAPDARGAQTMGVFFSTLSVNLLPLEWTADYQVLPPLGYQGRRVWRPIAGHVVPGAFAVTSACQDPAGVLAWVDTLYAEPGAVLAAIGQEGVEYLVDGDGTWRHTQAASQPSYLAGVTIAGGAAHPGISVDAFQRRFSDPVVRNISQQIDTVRAQVVTPFPPYVLSAAQVQAIAPLQAQLGQYVDEAMIRFIRSPQPITDAQWQEYAGRLNALGLEQFLSIWQSIYDEGNRAP